MNFKIVSKYNMGIPPKIGIGSLKQVNPDPRLFFNLSLEVEISLNLNVYAHMANRLAEITKEACDILLLC